MADCFAALGQLPVSDSPKAECEKACAGGGDDQVAGRRDYHRRGECDEPSGGVECQPAIGRIPRPLAEELGEGGVPELVGLSH